MWFDALSLVQKRAVVRERALMYLSDPMVKDAINACPPEVKDAAIALESAVRLADWSVKQ